MYLRPLSLVSFNPAFTCLAPTSAPPWSQGSQDIASPVGTPPPSTQSSTQRATWFPSAPLPGAVSWRFIQNRVVGISGFCWGKRPWGRKDFLSRFLPARHCQLSGRGPFCKSRGWFRHRPRRGENGAGYCHRAGLWVRVNVCWLSVPPQVQGQGCLWVLGP